MDFPQDQVDELTRTFSSVRRYDEGGHTYFFLPNLALPDGCLPKRVDALLCPMEHDGYPSRLFFAQEISSPATPRWNSSPWILGRTWHACSWRIGEPGLRLVQLVIAHLGALR